MRVTKEESDRYLEQYRSGLWASESPQLIGRLPLSLVKEFHELPPAIAYAYRTIPSFYSTRTAETSGVVEELKYSFAEIARVLSLACEVRYGWWTGTNDSYHIDGVPSQAQAVIVSALGPGTQYVLGKCNLVSRNIGMAFEPAQGTPVHQLEEGGVYRLGPLVIHREPPCEQPQNRLFFRTDPDY